MVPPDITGHKVTEPAPADDGPRPQADSQPNILAPTPGPADPTETARRTLPWKRRLDATPSPMDSIAKRTRSQAAKRPMQNPLQGPVLKQDRLQGAKRQLEEDDKQDESEAESKLPKLEEDDEQQVKEEDPMDVDSGSEEEFMDTVDEISSVCTINPI